MSLSRKLTAFAMLGVLAVLVVAWMGHANSVSQDRATVALSQMSRVLSVQWNADMMHDAMRADVFAAILAGTEQQDAFDVTRGEEDAAALLDNLARAGRLAPVSMHAAFGEVQQQAQLYTGQAKKLIATAGVDPGAARLALPQFLALFKQLEGALGAIDDELSAIVDRSEHESHAAAGQARTALLIVSAVTLAALALASTMLTRSATRPLRALTERMNEIATGDGDLTARVDETRRDELGSLGRAFNAFAERVRHTVADVAAGATRLTAAAHTLAITSTTLRTNAHDSASRTDAMGISAQLVSENVASVATGAEQMSASIQAIAENANEAAGVASAAVDTARSTNETVSRLGQSSGEIEEMVKVIASIAAQTNLLALNATIEAARAGEAGRGFAVVADEVKQLAQETAQATEDIGRRIDTIRADTGAAVNAIEEISDVVGRINEYQLGIAAAVEEQTATTNTMSRSTIEAAAGSAEIADTISTVAAAAQTTTGSIDDTRTAAAELATMGADLQQLVDQFRYST
jgi:methyl-accepting chemotaxis protein